VLLSEGSLQSPSSAARYSQDSDLTGSVTASCLLLPEFFRLLTAWQSVQFQRTGEGGRMLHSNQPAKFPERVKKNCTPCAYQFRPFNDVSNAFTSSLSPSTFHWFPGADVKSVNPGAHT